VAYTPEQLSDREAIRDVMFRYTHGVDRLDGDWMKSAFWPDAVDEHGPHVGSAWEFVDHCMESHVRWRSTMHCVFNHQIELEDDGVHARGEAYNVSYLFRADMPTAETWWGRYLDRYEKRDGEWRILHRVCVHEATRTLPASEMPLAWQSYRPGSFDRPSSGRPIGP